MSFTATALQLVNRVNRRRRISDLSAFSTELEMLSTLDAVNKAVAEVLAVRRWEFDIRRAELTIRGKLSDVTLSVTANTSTGALTKTGLVAADMYGDYVTRVLPKGSTSLADTALRILFASAPFADLSSFTFGTSIPFALSTTTAELFYSDYMLPDTVSNVVRVSHQEETVTLDEVGAKIEFSERYPRPQIEYGSPRVVSVGGFDVSTYNGTGTAPKPRLRLSVWPVPDEDYVLDYTYDYRHPEMSAATDVLDGVPPEVVDLIVDLATADMQANFDRRVDDARRLRSDAQSTLVGIHERHSGMYAERSSIGNWDGSGGSRVSRGGRTQGRLIGGG